MTDTASNQPRAASPGEVIAWFGVVGVLSFLVPGLPILVALVLDLTRLRASPLAVRIGLVAFAAAILVLQTIGLQGGSMNGTTGPAIPIG